MTLFRRHRDLDSRVAEAISRARDAGEMAAESQRRYEQVSETVIQPLLRRDEENQFARMVRDSLNEGTPR